jgi:hypothetical protein
MNFWYELSGAILMAETANLELDFTLNVAFFIRFLRPLVESGLSGKPLYALGVCRFLLPYLGNSTSSQISLQVRTVRTCTSVLLSQQPGRFVDLVKQ